MSLHCQMVTIMRLLCPSHNNVFLFLDFWRHFYSSDNFFFCILIFWLCIYFNNNVFSYASSSTLYQAVIKSAGRSFEFWTSLDSRLASLFVYLFCTSLANNVCSLS